MEEKPKGGTARVIVCCRLPQEPSDALLQRVRGVSAPWRLQKAAGQHPRNLTLSLAAGLALDYAFAKSGLPRCAGADEKGRPIADGGWSASLSHSGRYAVCALERRPVGVDVQKVTDVRPGVVKKVCSHAEQEALALSGNPERDFIRLWALKEAFYKASGGASALAAMKQASFAVGWEKTDCLDAHPVDGPKGFRFLLWDLDAETVLALCVSAEKTDKPTSQMPALDPRLQTVADLVREDSVVADIGCDHAKLLCALVSGGKAAGGIACDIRPGPLKSARQNIARFGLSDKIVCRLGDGLGAVSPVEADDLVLAGMGGELIAELLSRCGWDTLPDKHFILQPMTRAAILRHFLYRNGYSIIRERACRASGRCYTVMSVRYTGRELEVDPLDILCYVGALPQDPSYEARELLGRLSARLLRDSAAVARTDRVRAFRMERLARQIDAMTKGW